MEILILRQWLHSFLFILMMSTGVSSLSFASSSPVCHFLFQKNGGLGSGIPFSKNWVGENNLFRRYSYGAMRPIKKVLTYLPPVEKSSKKSNKRKYEKDEDLKDEEGGSSPMNLVPSYRLRIESVMQDFNLTRAQAVEVQAILRRYFQRASNEDFLQVVEQVRRGVSMSGVKYDNLERAKFIVAMDVDGTLLDQKHQSYGPFSSVHEHRFIFDGDNHGVTMAPGWESFFRGVKTRGGSVVIYSRNSDELIQNMFKYITINGVPVSDFVDGIFSSSHLVLPPNREGYVQDHELHDLVLKDLRILDATKTIIIDDEPKYIWQKFQTRLVPEFKARKLDPAYYRQQLHESESISLVNHQAESFLGPNFIARAMEEMNPFRGILKSRSKDDDNPKPKKDRIKKPQVEVPKIDPLEEAEKAATKRAEIFEDILKEIDWALEDAKSKRQGFASSYHDFTFGAVEAKRDEEVRREKEAEAARKAASSKPQKKLRVVRNDNE